MKRLFTFVLLSLFVTPGVIAQSQLPGPEVLFKEYLQRYSKVISKSELGKGVLVLSKTTNGKYTTKEQNEMEMSEVEEAAFYGNEPILSPAETRVTDTYNEAVISIPKGYRINKYIVIESPYANLYFPFLSARSILLTNKGEDISFQLDYDLELADAKDIEEVPTEYIDQALKMTIRYSPKYFTLKRDYSQNPARQVKVKYEGKDITLNVEVYPFLIITTPDGKDMVYVLEPNWQNLYNDFKFVREGHKPVQYRKIK